MSEHNEIAYIPTLSASQSCYNTVEHCQFGVLLIGKRYGSRDSDNLSITHKELRTLKEAEIPFYTFVDREVYLLKRVYDSNSSDSDCSVVFPDMHDASDVFKLINEVLQSPTNNGIIPFSHTAEAKQALKEQFSSLIYEYALNRNSGMRKDVKDILAAVTDIQHLVTTTTASSDQVRRMNLIRFLIEDSVQYYRRICEKMFSSLDFAVDAIPKASSFSVLVANAGFSMEIFEGKSVDRFLPASSGMFTATQFYSYGDGLTSDENIASWALLRDQRLLINQTALNHFTRTHAHALAISSEAQRVPSIEASSNG